MIAAARETILEITGRDPICPAGAGWVRQMHAFRLPAGIEPDPLQTALRERYRIEVPVRRFGDEILLRISAQGYNRPEEYRLLADALAELLPAMRAGRTGSRP
jgi:isopenicillin-N epimerase